MSTHFKFIASATAIAFVTFAAAAPAALAQETQQQAPGVTAPAPTTNLDDGKLKSFAVAYLQVDKIKKQYEPQIQKAGSDTAKEKIRTEASKKMMDAVNSVQGMSVQEYSSILASAQANPGLAQKLSDKINETASTDQ